MAPSRSAAAPAPLTPLTHLYLYDEPEAAGLSIEALAAYLAAVLPACEVLTRRDFFTHHLARFSDEQREVLGEQLMVQLQRVRVDNLVPPDFRLLLPIDPPDESEWGEVYHAPSLQAVLRLLLPPEEEHLSHLHLVCTELVLGTWPGGDQPLELLPALFGEPNLLSIPGLLEGLRPAREYEFLRVQMAMFGLEEGLDAVEDRFAGQMLSEADPRLNQVLEGFALQAVFYRLYGEAFCLEPTCRLFNATNFEELLAAQTGPGTGLCARHREWLRELGAAPERA
ncbi:MAG TPA: DUF6775 family putative metallopeptidase [Armatimonadota bacterium]